MSAYILLIKTEEQLFAMRCTHVKYNCIIFYVFLNLNSIFCILFGVLTLKKGLRGYFFYILHLNSKVTIEYCPKIIIHIQLFCWRFSHFASKLVFARSKKKKFVFFSFFINMDFWLNPPIIQNYCSAFRK